MFFPIKLRYVHLSVALCAFQIINNLEVLTLIISYLRWKFPYRTIILRFILFLFTQEDIHINLTFHLFDLF
jgi:hypothetical protein